MTEDKKEECVLCILRDKDTKKAKSYEWISYSREKTEKRVEEVNQTMKNEYY